MYGSIRNILAILMLLNAGLYAQKSVKMSVSASEMFKNDTFELEIKLENFDSDVNIQYPRFADLAKIAGPYQSSSTSIINGTMTKSVSLTYQFAPKKLGKIVIEPAVVTEGGASYKSNEIAITVFEQGQNTAASQSRDMFITAELSSRNVYVGEMIKIDYILYIKPEIRLSMPSLAEEPKFTNFVKEQEEFSREKASTLTQTVYKGQKYNMLPVRSYWLTPTSSGNKVIEPITVKVPVEVKSKKRRSPFNDPFFDDDLFSGFTNYADKTVLADEIKITVNPLPDAGRPSDFTGAVGSFNINSTVDNDSIAVNDGITLKVIISGKGNLSDIALSQPSIPKDFEVYDPKRTVQLDRNSKNSGKVIYEYLLLARTPGEQLINNISLSYFDTKEKKYKTSIGKEHRIVVTGDAAAYAGSQRPAGYSRRDVEVLASDIRYIKKNFENIYDISDKGFDPDRLGVNAGISVLLMLSAFFGRLYILKNLNDTALSRRKKAVKNANKRLKNSVKALEANDMLKFYKTLDEALLKFIADKFNISHAGIISDEIIAVLTEKGVEETMRNDLSGLLMKSASIQFAPSKPDSKEMATDLEKAKNLMSGLNERLK
ncbi:MAG: hypothetical protein A2Y39_01500 [Candidatus Delongbacteria bacterium GWF2_40_14]|nr:MAG: hypothetical protein A2Y39_01500 [Candidatus Delongbacteria bacterium GWF2_40_14]